jgi:hypothetical protein
MDQHDNIKRMRNVAVTGQQTIEVGRNDYCKMSSFGQTGKSKRRYECACRCYDRIHSKMVAQANICLMRYSRSTGSSINRMQRCGTSCKTSSCASLGQYCGNLIKEAVAIHRTEVDHWNDIRWLSRMHRFDSAILTKSPVPRYTVQILCNRFTF